MNNTIKHFNIAVTNKCNLQCKMCDIWKENPKTDISLNIIENIMNSKFLDKNADISITGGEPFLHLDLEKIIKLILKKNRNSLKTITTNGFFTNKIIEFLNTFNNLIPEDFSINISLDGIKTHNEQRGVSCYNNVIETISQIKKLFPLINIKLKFTITPINYKEIIEVYNFAKINNIEFNIKLVEYSKNYTNTFKNNNFTFDNGMKKEIVKNLLQIYKEKKLTNPINSEFIKNTIKLLLGKNEKIKCSTPFERVFIMPSGEVFSCVHFDSIGNLTKNNLEEIWQSEKAEIIREQINNKNCALCVSYHGYNK